MRTILVSRCLLGEACRYDGRCGKPVAKPLTERDDLRVVAVCPEVDGGLSTPRAPAEIECARDGFAVLAGKARVLTAAGTDVTDAYLKGAHAAVDAARRFGAKEALLRAKSPSCGVTQHYDGTYAGVLTAGPGVAAAALIKAGLTVIDDAEREKLEALLAP